MASVKIINSFVKKWSKSMLFMLTQILESRIFHSTFRTRSDPAYLLHNVLSAAREPNPHKAFTAPQTGSYLQFILLPDLFCSCRLHLSAAFPFCNCSDNNHTYNPLFSARSSGHIPASHSMENYCLAASASFSSEAKYAILWSIFCAKLWKNFIFSSICCLCSCSSLR